MKTTLPLITALAALASAQDLSSIPACALTCMEAALSKSTKCTATDFKCICDNLETITAGATGCVLDACGLDTALNKVLPATQSLCASLPAAPAPAPPAVSPPAVSSKPAGTPAAPAPSSAAPVMPPKYGGGGDDEKPAVPDHGDDEDCASTTLKTSVLVPVPTSAPSVTVVPKPPVNTTVPAKPPVVTAGAAGKMMGSLGVVVLGVVAAL